MQHNKLKSIRNFGQSIWLDFFDRKIMDSGKLKELVEIDGISGVTANPSIFEKAINSSSDYDSDISAIGKQIVTNEEIFIDLAVKDIKQATGYFESVFHETNGNDGFVSLEVSPRLAYNTEGTVGQARDFWKAINRKNAMIKIPGTKEGLPAIRKCISEGININITLLFGLPRYTQIADAYIAGLEDRVKTNKAIDQVTSVASFFVSRIDALIDPLLEKKGLGKLKGEVAVASAKRAYEIYKEVFSSERFKKLQIKGAKRQRLLWASTSSKDPSFSDVKYVEALIGPETINTIPIETLQAFNDHGNAESCLERDLEKATHLMVQLKESGIDIDTVTQTLENEGIEKFDKAYDNLLKAIGNKRYADF